MPGKFVMCIGAFSQDDCSEESAVARALVDEIREVARCCRRLRHVLLIIVR